MIKSLRKALYAACGFALAMGASTLPLHAADHGDAPNAANDISADLADTYFFLDPNDNNFAVMAATVKWFLVPGQNASFGIFDPGVRVQFQIDNAGDAGDDLLINVTFKPQKNAKTDPQIAEIDLPGQFGHFHAPTTVSSGTAAAPPAQVVTTDPTSNVSFFAGLTDDPFFFDLVAFNRFVASVKAGNPDATVFNRARDTFAGYNLMTVALRVPVSMIRGAANNNIVRLSAATQRRKVTIEPEDTPIKNVKNAGKWVTIDREGVPAANTVLIPFLRKNEYNESTAKNDANGRFATDIVASLTALGTDQAHIGILADVAVTHGDRLTLDLSKANTGNEGGTNAGAGFPNGRRLADDVIDTLLTLVANGNALGDNVDANDVPFQNVFPFVAPSHQPLGNGVVDDLTRN